MNWKYVLIIVIVAAIAVGSVFWITMKSQEKPEKPAGDLSIYSFSDFVKKISRIPKATTGDGIMPDPPRAMMKEAERFAEMQVKNPVKIDYAFTSDAANPSASFSLALYATPNPFRWRVDFIMNLKDGEYKNVYLYDGSTYRTCRAEANAQLKCSTEPQDFLEKYITTPLILTDFLNDFFEPLSLKKLVPDTEESRKANFQKYTKTVAGYPGNCQVTDDEYSTLDFCLAEDENLLLYLNLKKKSRSGTIFGHYTLTAQNVDSSTLPQEVFVSP